MEEKFSKRTILIVDDSPDNIDILRSILHKEYRVIVALNGATALKLTESMKLPDLILLDIMMPVMNGYELCQSLKYNIKTRNIPIIFVTAKEDVIDEAKGFELGAVDYITKPIRPAVVKARIRTHLALYDQSRVLEEKVYQRTAELKETRLEIIRKLGLASEYKDNETGMHIMRISYFCRLLGSGAGLNEEENELLFQAAPMHDVGKIGIPDRILLKHGKLDAEEWEIIKEHTVIGANIMGNHNSDLLKTAHSIALTHHEKWDGTGYPQGLSGNEIPLVGRIVALADVYDALTSKRPYKEAWPFDKTIAYIHENKSKHFDPNLTEIFLEKSSEILKISKEFSDNQLTAVDMV
jgi:putative two-component system response regulator